LKGTAEFLRLKTLIVKDEIYLTEGTRMERLLAIAGAAGADRYLSGPSARDILTSPCSRPLAL